MTTPVSEEKLRDEFQRLEMMDHLCAMGRDEGEKLNILTSFLLTGLSNNEKTICIVDKKTQSEIIDNINRKVKLLESINTHLEFIVEEEIFHSNSNFDPDRIIHLVNYIIEKTPREDFEDFRIITDYSWILKRKLGKQRINEYESKLSDLTIENECKTLCLYDENTTDSSALLNVLLSHSKTVIQGKLCNNILFDNSSMQNGSNQAKLSQDLYESITQHLLKSAENLDEIGIIKEQVQEEILRNKVKSENLYRNLFENTGTAMILTEEDMSISLINSKCEQLFGWKKEEIEGKIKWTELISHYDIKKLPDYSRNEEERNKAVPNEYEAKIISKSGEIKSVELIVSPVPVTQQNVISMRDITARKATADELAKSEEKYRNLIESTKILICKLEEDGTIIFVNPFVKALTGYEPEELIGKIWWDIFYPGELQNQVKDLYEILAQKEVNNYEMTLKTRRGNLKTISWSSFCLRDKEGKIIEIDGIGVDITEKIESEEERRVTEKQLMLMKHSFDSSLSGIVISDMQRNITYVNTAMLRLWGYENPNDLIGKNGMEIIPYSYTSEEDFQRSRESMAQTGQWSGDVNAIRSDGSPFWTRMIANFVYNTDNIPVAMMLSFIDISNQKEAEEALKISEEKSRRIINNSPIGIMISSIEGNMKSANQSAVKIFGYDSEESFISSVNTFGADKKLYAFPDSRNQFVKFIANGKKWYKDENQFIKKDGTIITLRVQSHLIVENTGEEMIETFIEDVTENRRNEDEREKAVQALLKSEEKLKILNEELEERVKQRTFQMETLHSLNRDIYLSPNILEAMEVISNYLQNHGDYDLIMQIIEQERLNHIHVNSISLDKKYLEKMINDLKAEFGFYKQDILNNRDNIIFSSISKSSTKESQTNLSIPLLVGENIIGFILIGSSEKTEYSEDEIWFLYRLADNISQTLEHLKAILTAKEELETVLNHSSNGIILLNSNKEIVMSNVVGKEIINVLGVDLMEKIDDSIFNFELLLNNQKQEIIINEQTFITELSEIKTDFVQGMLLNLKNETDERKLQKLIMQQERLAIVGQLTGGVAHDFNNILASIIGAADFALMNLENLESRELLNLIIRQSERGASLIRQMLDFTRQTVVSPKPLNIQLFINEISRVLRASLPTNIALNVKNSLSTVLMDQIQLQQLLMNLIFNSRDAMPDGGEISLYVDEVDYSEVKDFEENEINKNHQYVHFRVQDNGEGMTLETMKKAFEPFYTTKGPGKGSGLGLSQVYGIVRQSNGYIFIESQPENGTSVHFYIPKHLGNVEEEQLEETSIGKGKILLVEDDDDVRDIIKIMLENYGYVVTSAINGEVALEIFNDSFDLVLTDIMMPIMGGNELIRELLLSNPNIKCLAMTGYADVKVPDGIEIIHKPMTSSKLVNHVQNLIDHPNGKLQD